MSNSDKTILQPPTITVGFERKIQTRDYENAIASIYVQAPVAGTWGDDGVFQYAEGALNEAALAAFFEAKVAVLKQLSLEYDVIDNVVVENIDRILGPAEVVSTTPKVASAPKASKPASGKWGDNPPSTKDGLYEELVSNPDRYFDNRESKKSPKAPDFKRKFSGDGVWLDRAPEFVTEWAESYASA